MTNNIAVLDIGTNSFHLVIATVTPFEEIKILKRIREVIRLSEGYSENKKVISQKSIEQAVKTIHKFKSVTDSYNAPIRAIATSALREAFNKNEFLEIVVRQTGVRIEVISGNEEARLINIGIKKGLPNIKDNTISIDIGGGSTEFIARENGEIKFVDSIKIGAVKITQKFIPDFILSDTKLIKTEKWIEKEIIPIMGKIGIGKFDQFIGTSGTILNVGMMIKAMRGEEIGEYTSLSNFEFTSDELNSIEKEVLSRKGVEERKLILGLDEKRADIIPAGIIILSTIFRLLKIEKMIISNYALKEGVIIDSLFLSTN